MRFLVALWAAWVFGQTPGQVMIVVNRNSPASMEIAAYYAAKRQIPPVNVCRIATKPDEIVKRPVYENEIEPAVAACLARNGLAEKINYLVTTLGVPLHIYESPGKNTSAASVDSELALVYQRRKGKKLPLHGPLPNPYFRQKDTPFEHRLFPIYLVTRLAAYDVESVKRMIERGLRARNRGKVFLDMRDGGEGNGESWLRNTFIFLPNGRAFLEETRQPLHDVKGAIGYGSWGSNDRSRKRRATGFEWLPGAVATEFVSTDGRSFRRPPAQWQPGEKWAGTRQSMAADFIEEGASGASGHTDEPYLGMCPRPEILFPAYLSGRNLAESFYLSIPALSWMNIVIGDPLMRLAP